MRLTAINFSSIDPGLRTQILLTIQNVFDYTTEQAEKVFLELMLCVRKKHLVSSFRTSQLSGLP